MKISSTKFVLLFVVSGFLFQFLSNSLLGSEIGLFPKNGEWLPGTGSPIAWKSTVSAIIYPIKLVLIGPMSSLFANPDPDTPPPLFVLAFAIYWTAMAFVIYYLLSIIFTRKKKAINGVRR